MGERHLWYSGSIDKWRTDYVLSSGGDFKFCPMGDSRVYTWQLWEYDPDSADERIASAPLGPGAYECDRIDSIEDWVTDGDNNRAEFYVVIWSNSVDRTTRSATVTFHD